MHAPVGKLEPTQPLLRVCPSWHLLWVSLQGSFCDASDFVAKIVIEPINCSQMANRPHPKRWIFESKIPRRRQRAQRANTKSDAPGISRPNRNSSSSASAARLSQSMLERARLRYEDPPAHPAPCL